MPSLSEIQKKYRNYNPQGRTCIYTVVSGNYQAFVPLFEASIKLAAPDFDVIVGYLGDYKQMEYPSLYELNIPDAHKRTSAAVRFVSGDGLLEDYDYVLITDIDIVFAEELNAMVKGCMMWMDINGTECYNNWLSGPEQVPGVHFVTKAWWKRTFESRMKELDKIMNAKDMPYFYDELMLYRIIADSKLPLPKPIHQPWLHYGLHLGACRNMPKMMPIPHSEGARLLISGKLDQEIAIAAKEFPWINELLRRINSQ